MSECLPVFTQTYTQNAVDVYDLPSQHPFKCCPSIKGEIEGDKSNPQYLTSIPPRASGKTPSTACVCVVGGVPPRPVSLACQDSPEHSIFTSSTQDPLLAACAPFSYLPRLGLTPEAAGGPSHPPRVPPSRPLRAARAPARHPTAPRRQTVTPPSPTFPDAGGPGVSWSRRPGRQAQAAALGRSSPVGRRGALAVGAGSLRTRAHQEDPAVEGTEVSARPPLGLGAVAVAVALAANCHRRRCRCCRCCRRRHSLLWLPCVLRWRCRHAIARARRRGDPWDW